MGFVGTLSGHPQGGTVSDVKIESWPGRGYIRIVGHGKDQRRVYVIQKRVDGEKFHVSTRCDDPGSAEVQFKRFMENPRAYTPAGDESEPERDPIYMTGHLIEDFLTYSAFPEPQENRRPNSKPWLYKKRLYLSWWAEMLRSVNLRQIDLKEHVYPALRQRTGRAQRIAVLKDFFGWLRNVEFGPGLLDTDEGRCIDLDLHVPQSAPKQQTERKWFPRESHVAAVKAIRKRWQDNRKWNPSKPEVCWMADCCEVLSETGWHLSELHRFIHKLDGAGAIEKHPACKIPLPNGKEEIADKVLVTRQKGGQFHRTRVTNRVAAIAERLQKNGVCDVNRFTNMLAEVCEAENITPAVTPGTYRHSVATWMYNAGVPLADISMFLGHSSPATTKRFYAALGVALNPMLDWHARRPAA